MKKQLRNSLIAGMLALALVTTAVPLPRAQAASTDLQAQIQALLAQVAQLQSQLVAQTGSTATHPSITLTRNLALGATGDDVRQLQRFLNADPDTRVALSGVGSPGQETAYFGPMTHQAVIKFQNKYRGEVLTPVGLSQGTGYVGASTRAHIAKLVASGGTQKPNPNTPIPGGNDNSNDNGGAIIGTEGDISVTRGSEHSSTLNLGSSDNIYAADIKARGSAMTIERMDFMFDKRPWRYIKSFELYHNDKKIKTVQATENAFTSVGNEYRLRISGLNATVNDKDKDSFTLRATAVNALTSSRENDILSVYIPRDGIRAMDTLKIRTSEPGSALDARSFNFRNAENDGAIIVSLSSHSPQSGLLGVNEKTVKKDVPVLIASIRADDSDITLREMYVKVESSASVTSDVVRKLSLRYDGTVIATESVVKNGASPIMGTDEDGNSYTIIGANEYYVRFTDLDKKDIEVEEDDRIEVTLLAEFGVGNGSKYPAGTNVTFTIRAVMGENSHDEDVVNGNLTIGDNRSFSLHTNGLTFSHKSTDVRTLGSNDSTGVFKISFDVTAFGNDIYVPMDSARQTGTSSVGSVGAEYSIQTSGGNIYTLGNSSASLDIANTNESGNYYVIPEGATRTVTMTVSLDNKGEAQNFFRVILKEFRYRVGSASGPEHTITDGFKEMRTSYLNVNN